MSQPGDGSGPQSAPLQLPSPLSMQGGMKFFSLLLHVFMADSLAAFARLQLADRFTEAEQQLTAAQLASKTGCHTGRLHRLLEHMQDLGVVQKLDSAHSGPADDEYSNDLWQLTADGALLRSSHPGRLRSAVLWLQGDCMRWQQDRLDQAIQDSSDSPLTLASRYALDHGATTPDFWAWLHSPPQRELHAVFDAATSAGAASDGPLLAQLEAGLLSTAHTLVDIGGGQGALAASLANSHPQLQAVYCADLPAVVNAARQREEAARYGLQDRLQYLEIDFMNPAGLGALTGVCDVAAAAAQPIVLVLKQVLHDWNDADCVRILSNVREAVCQASGAAALTVLLLVEHHVLPVSHPAARQLNWMIRCMDSHMLVLGGQQRSHSQWQRLLAASGWSFKGYKVGQAPTSVVEAVIA